MIESIARKHNQIQSKTRLAIGFFFLSLSFLGMAQNSPSSDRTPLNQVNLLNTDYKDFVSVKNVIYAIAQNNDLVTIDIKTNNFKILQHNVAAVAKKSNGDLIFGSSDGKVFIYRKNQKIRQIDQLDAKIFTILINTEDDYVVYSNKSIYYKNREYIPEKETNFYGKVLAKYTGTQLIEPDYIFLDRMNFLWFAFEEGEWGGRVCFFDLRKKEFIYDIHLMLHDEIKYKDRNEYFTKLKATYPDKIKVTATDTLYKYPYEISSSSIQGMAYDQSNNLVVSSSGGGVSPPYENDKGFTYFIDGTLNKNSKMENGYYKKCFDQKFLKMGINRKSFKKNEIDVLGPIAFNPFDGKLYMYSSKGFFALNDLNCKFTKELLFKPELNCRYDSGRDFCLHLNIFKFEFISEKEILFLTRSNGIGYYNGEHVEYLR